MTPEAWSDLWMLSLCGMVAGAIGGAAIYALRSAYFQRRGTA